MANARFVVYPWQEGLRCDQFLAAASGLSRRRARRLLSEGQVAFEGRVLRVQSRAVKVGDVYDLLFPKELARELDGGAVEGPAPSPPAVRVLFEDTYLLAVDKPAGVLSQPTEKSRVAAASREDLADLALDERVLIWLAGREGRRPFLRLLHRLDRPTSGVTLFGRTPQAVAALARAWKAGEVERRYWAVVEGWPEVESTLVEAPLARDPEGAWRFEVAAGGQEARTEVWVLERGEGEGGRFSRVECRLFTGRTHQVRVHLSHLGHPVVGDRLYGARPGAAERPLLHARFLRGPHPSGQGQSKLEVESPLPEDFAPFWGVGEGAHGR